MKINYEPAPVDTLPGKNRAGGKAPTGRPHSSMFNRFRAVEAEEVRVVRAVAGMPLEEVKDGVNPKHGFMGGCPRPLRRTD